MISSHRLVARMPDSRSGDRGSSPRESICPTCRDRIGPDDDVVATAGLPVSPGDYTVCLTCREIIRFDVQLRLRKMNCQDWLDLSREKAMFIGMLRWRMRILLDQLDRRK